MMAGITIPNAARIALHERFGFQRVGTLRRIGYQHGAWHDVGLWQRWVTGQDTVLDPSPMADSPPPPIRSLDEIGA